MAKAQETTQPSVVDAAADSSGNVYNSPRIVGGQAVTDRTQYAYQVLNKCGIIVLLHGK